MSGLHEEEPGGAGGLMPRRRKEKNGDDRHPLAQPLRPSRRAIVAIGLLALLVAAVGFWSFEFPPDRRPSTVPAIVGMVGKDPPPTPAPPPDADPACPVCPQMVRVPAGEFIMGAPAADDDAEADERPQHRVTIARPFAVSANEVTFEQWSACVEGGGCNGYSPEHEGWGRGRRPVINVAWEDVQAYVTWLSARTGQRYRLLTEAEWEYVSRAGTTTRYWWGDDVGRNCANCQECGSRWDDSETAPVGSFPANAFGLHDSLGNVWEWVEDCYNPNYRAAPTDGAAWLGGKDCTHRVLRGGSWDNTPRIIRVTERIGGEGKARSNNAGFRVAKDLAPGE